MRYGVVVLCVSVVLATILPSGCSERSPQKAEFECLDEIGCVSLKPGAPLKIAVLQPLSGRLMRSGTGQIRGIELALDRRDNQLFEHPIELQLEDSQCSAEGGAVAALKVVADPEIVAIIGPNCSGAGVQASKIMSEAGLVMISGTNSAASLTSAGGEQGADWHPGYFRTMYNSIRRGEAAAIFAFREFGLTRAATINDGDPRSIELTDIFERTFSQLGGEIVLSTAVDRQDTNMKPVLNRAADSRAELIFFPIFPPETSYITLQAQEISALKDTALMVCGSTMRSDTFLNEVGEAGKGMFFVGKALLSGEKHNRLRDTYEAKYDEEPGEPNYGFAFDAANILLNALESVAVQEEDGTLHIGRQALRDAMYATSGFDGVTGTLSCDQFGDCGTPKFNILRLDDPAAGLDGLLANEVFLFTPESGVD